MPTIDSYSESNYSNAIGLGNSFYFRGQVFYASANYTLTSASFYMQKNGSPTSNVYARIYAITGTPGSTAVPTGSVLATSDAVDASTISASLALNTFTFSGANQIALSSGTWYCITLYYPVVDAINELTVCCDDSDVSHSGNFIDDDGAQGTAWRALDSYDLCFYVYGDAALPFGSATDTTTLTESVTVGMSDIGVSVVDAAIITERIGDSGAIIDSYPESNYSTVYSQIYSASPGCGQIFYAATSHIITSATFYLSKLLAPTGYAYAKLYPITGTPGTDAIPDGAAGAVSDAFDVSTLSDSSFRLVTFTFSGDNQVELYSPAWYAITVEYTGGDTSNRVKVAADTSAPTHDGNTVTKSVGTWIANSSSDSIFYVNGDSMAFVEGIIDAVTVVDSVAVTVLLSDVHTVVEGISPVASLSSEMGQRFTADSIAPVFSGAGVFGSITEEKAPLPSVEGTLSSSEYLTLSKKAPVVSCFGLFGSGMDGTIGTANCTAEIAAVWIELNTRAPVSAVNGSLSEEAVLQLTAKSPFYTLGASAYGEGISLNAKAPVWYLSTLVGRYTANGVMFAKAPVAVVRYNSMLVYSSGMNIDAVAPVGTLQVDTGESDTDLAESMYSERLDSYTLEYVR